MADNVAITPGTGATVAADDIGGALHQRVKISQGADGSATDVSSAAPLQVSLANHGANSTAVKVDGSAATQPVSGTVTANAGTNLNTSALATEAGGVATIATKTTNLVTALGSTALDLGASTGGSRTLRVAIDTAQVPTLGRAAVTGSIPVVHAGYEYELVAASASTQTLGATGAVGDFLAGVLIVPETTGAGTVAIKDGSNTAINIFVTGTLSNLVPFMVPLGLTSVQGAWQVTTGANVHAIGIGDFT